MIFLFFYWADQNPALWKITLIFSLSCGAAPRWSLILAWWLPLRRRTAVSCILDLYSYLPVLVAAHQWGARRDQRDSSCATQDLGCVRSLFTSSPLFVMLLETIVWFPKLMQPALEFSNSCGSRCAGWWGGPGKTESWSSSKLQDSSMTFLIKCSHPTFAVLQSNAFFFLIDLPKLKLLRQTDRTKGPLYIHMQSDVQHAILKFCGFNPHIHLGKSNNWFVHYSL